MNSTPVKIGDKFNNSRGTAVKTWELWCTMITSFIEKGANIELAIPNLAVTMLAETFPTQFSLEFTFIFDGSILPILITYLSGREACLGIIHKLQSLGTPSKACFKCLQLRSYSIRELLKNCRRRVKLADSC